MHSITNIHEKMLEFNNKMMHQLIREIPCPSNPLLSASVLVNSMYDGVINFTFAKKYGEDGHLVANYLPACLFHCYGEGIMKYLTPDAQRAVLDTEWDNNKGHLVSILELLAQECSE